MEIPLLFTLEAFQNGCHCLGPSVCHEHNEPPSLSPFEIALALQKWLPKSRENTALSKIG